MLSFLAGEKMFFIVHWWYFFHTLTRQKETFPIFTDNIEHFILFVGLDIYIYI